MEKVSPSYRQRYPVFTHIMKSLIESVFFFQIILNYPSAKANGIPASLCGCAPKSVPRTGVEVTYIHSTGVTSRSSYGSL